MKVLHTADWHIGKNVAGINFLPKQKEIFDELIQISNNNNIDVILVAGDIFDQINPSNDAAKLFSDNIVRLAEETNSAIFVIAGNHDSYSFLSIFKEAFNEKNIFILSNLVNYKNESTTLVNFIEQNNYTLTFEYKNERTQLTYINFPVPEKFGYKLNIDKYKDIQTAYSKFVSDILTMNISTEKETNKIALGHIFVSNGYVSGDEKILNVGSNYYVDGNDIPDSFGYVALGHLHDKQKAINTSNAFYCGSPLQFHPSSKQIEKGVYIFDIKNNIMTNHEFFPFSTKISLVQINEKYENIYNAISKYDENTYFFIKLIEDENIPADEYNTLKFFNKNIISITYESNTNLLEKHFSDIEINDFNITDIFKDFFRKIRGIDANKETIEIFKKYISESGENETN